MLVTNIKETAQTAKSLINPRAEAIVMTSISDMINELPEFIKKWEISGINEIATIGQLSLSENPIYN